MKEKTTFVNKFFILFGDEKKQKITIPLFSILISLIVSSIIILITGKNPILAYTSLLKGAGILPKPNYAAYKNMLTDFVGMLNALTPMILASLSVAIAFKAGLFNIGVSGQMLFAGFVSTMLVGYAEGINPLIAKPLVIIIAAISGGMIGALIGFLKYKRNINEVVSSIMTNYIIMYAISFLINSPKLIDPISRQSKPVLQSSRLTLMDTGIGGLKMDLPLGIILAFITVFLVKFVLDKTKMGYEIKAVGANRDAANYAGIDVGRNIVMTMFISGALAGLAGATYYLGYYGSIRPKVLPNLGFDSIAVALLGNSNPIAIIFSSLLMTIIGNGSIYMSSIAKVPQEFSSVITGIILIFVSCSNYISHLIKKHAKNL